MSHADEQTQPRAALDALLIPGTDDDVRALYQALAEAARDATPSLMEDDVIVVDTETTGLDPAYCSLIEIAALRMNGPDIVGRFQTFVNPGCSIPEEITELTGITNADIADAPSPREAVAAFAQFAGGCDLIAHNAPFDRAFVMRRAEPGALGGAWVDTLVLSQIRAAALEEPPARGPRGCLWRASVDPPRNRRHRGARRALAHPHRGAPEHARGPRPLHRGTLARDGLAAAQAVCPGRRRATGRGLLAADCTSRTHRARGAAHQV